MFTDDRGQATTVGYVLSIAVAATLVIGLTTGVGTFVENQQEQAIQDQLTVIGERLATQFTAVDALAAREGTVYVEPAVPVRAVGMNYRVRIINGTDSRIVLSTSNPDVTVTVPVSTTRPLANSTTEGTNLAVYYGENGISVGERR